eukprot:624266-Pyramimonas_sp.AAC.1
MVTLVGKPAIRLEPPVWLSSSTAPLLVAPTPARSAASALVTIIPMNRMLGALVWLLGALVWLLGAL